MPTVTLEKPRRAMLDHAHPLSKQMAQCFLLDETGSVRDLVKKDIGSKTAGTVSLSPSKLGKSLYFGGNAYYTTAKLLGRTTLPMSFAFGVCPRSFVANNGLFKTVTSTAYSGIWSHLMTTGQLLVSVGEGSGSGSGERRTTVTVNGIAVNQSTHIAIVINSYSSHTIYFNGIQQAVTVSGTGSSFGTTTTGGQIGRFSDVNNTFYLTGMLHYFYVYDRKLTQAEAYLLAGNPYAMFLKETFAIGVTVSGTTVRLTWTDNSEGEDGSSIERDDDGGGFVEIDTVAAGVETYDDTVDEGHTYTYRVRATSAALGDSEYSNEVEVTV